MLSLGHAWQEDQEDTEFRKQACRVWGRLFPSSALQEDLHPGSRGRTEADMEGLREQRPRGGGPSSGPMLGRVLPSAISTPRCLFLRKREKQTLQSAHF